MKKILSVILCILFVFFALCGCNNTQNNSKIKIVTTYFSAYDWTKNILGDNRQNAELILLCDNGVDMHSYEPTADDIIDIKTADILIYVGGTSDKWVEDSIEKDTFTKVINSIELLSERLLYSKEDSHEHEGHTHSGDTADEHIWLSLKNAISICKSIKNALSEIDSENSNLYKNNLKNYSGKLNEISGEFDQKFESTKNKTLIFADRFPFRYTLADYSLKYISLFEGCSSESDATVDAVLSLSKAIDDTNAKSVFIIDTPHEKTAKTVIKNSKNKNADILKLDSMQNITKDKLKSTSYISVMKDNLDKFYNALV